MRPVLCLITDRRRFGDAWQSALVDHVAAAARAGVHLIQLRERDLDAAVLARLTQQCVAALDGTSARLLVNDRLDVALAAGAHGVHLRADSMSAARARQVTPPGFLLGRSIHSIDEAADATSGAVDYLIFGTVFETGSKPGRTAAGLDRLAQVACATSIPVLAVGGVSVDQVAAVARTGASGVAGIGLFAGQDDARLTDLVRRANSAFDTPYRVP